MKANALLFAAGALALAVPVHAQSTQVAARPGVSLTEAAQEKFNRDTRPDDRHVFVMPGMSSPSARAQLAAEAGVTPDEANTLTLGQLLALKVNREGRMDEQQMVPGGPTSMATRSMGSPAERAQLIAEAGLTPEEGAGKTLTELAVLKYNREARTGDLQRIVD